MGSPDFAATVLEALLGWKGGRVSAVYTQPDRPCGRGQTCKPTPVKELALKHGLPVHQPENFKDQAAIDELAAMKPDLLVVAAYGLILPQAVLDIPRLMPVNVHASLLPRYRGAAPIQAALLNGDLATGITIMRMEAGLDSGPILAQRALRIGYEDTAETLHDQLAGLGGELLIEFLEGLAAGVARELDQDEELASYAPKLTKAMGEIDFDRPAETVHDHVRAMHPWPGAYFTWTDGRKPVTLSLVPGRAGRELTETVPPGTILGQEEGLLAIACRDKVYLTPEVKPRGKKALDPASFCCGYMNVCQE